MKSKDDLIYDLIFNDETEFSIDVSEYIVSIYRYEDFVDELKDILEKSKVRIIDSHVNLNSKTVIWELKVEK